MPTYIICLFYFKNIYISWFVRSNLRLFKIIYSIYISIPGIRMCRHVYLYFQKRSIIFFISGVRGLSNFGSRSGGRNRPFAMHVRSEAAVWPQRSSGEWPTMWLDQDGHLWEECLWSLKQMKNPKGQPFRRASKPSMTQPTPY